MKKIILGVTLFVTALGFSQSPIRTQKYVKKRIEARHILFAEAEHEEDKSTFFYKCYQFQGISIFTSFQLTPNDTEKLYDLLTNNSHNVGEVVEIPTLDKKVVRVEIIGALFGGKCPKFEVIEKDMGYVYHIWRLPKKQTAILFNKA